MNNEPVAWMQIHYKDKMCVTKLSPVKTWEDDVPLYLHPVDAVNTSQEYVDKTQNNRHEPVAWIDPRELDMEVSTTVTKNKWDKDDIPLYTHPVKELTDEEIYEFTHRMIICSGQNPNAADINIFGLTRIVEDILRKAQEK